MTLLNSFSKSSIDNFASDFFFIMNVTKHIDNQYAQAKKEFISDFAHLKKLLREWNSKYPNLILEPDELDMQLRLKVIIKETDILAVGEKAIRIGDMVLINGKNIPLGKFDLKDLVGSRPGKLNFINEDNNSLTIAADKEGVKLVYSFKDMLQENSPEFHLCAYYALKQVNDVDLQKYGIYFSFSTEPEEQEGKAVGYLDTVRLFRKI
jgi:hypothetical protein